MHLFLDFEDIVLVSRFKVKTVINSEMFRIQIIKM